MSIYRELVYSEVVRALEPAFGTTDVLLVSDNREIVGSARDAGLRATFLDGLPSLRSEQREDVVMVLTDDRRYPSIEFLFAHLSQSRVLLLPACAFSGSLSDATYGLALFQGLDLDTVVGVNQEWLELLSSGTSDIAFKSTSGTDLLLKLPEELYVAKPKIEAGLAKGEWLTPAYYMETMLLTAPGRRVSYRANGEAVVPGVAVAHHWNRRDISAEPSAKAWDETTRWREEGRFPLKITLEDSRVVQVLAGSKDVTRQVLHMTASEENLLNEWAFGTNKELDPARLDFQRNSPMNESSTGFHFALGEGIYAPHIDFICPDVEMIRHA